MSRRLLSPGLLAAVWLSVAVPSLAAAQPTPDAPNPPATEAQPLPAGGAPGARDRADELFGLANEAFDADKVDEAYALYQQAFALKRTYDIAGNLGQVELKMGKFRDAAEHLSFTLRFFPPTGKDAPREAIRRAFDAARKEVGTLTIKVNVQGAAVSIDGKLLGRSPFATEVFVEPGKRTLEASLEAHLPTHIVIEIAKNERRNVDLSLTPKAQPPPPPRNVPLLLTGFGLSLAAAGSGLGLMIGASNKSIEADGLLQQIYAGEPGATCPCGSDKNRARLKGLRQDHDLFFNAAVGLFAGAGVLALGTAVYALTPSFQKAPSRTARIVPVVSEHGGGALVVGSF